MRVLFTGGGTGGHITPGLAVLDALRASDPEIEAAWVGTPDHREAELVPREGIPFHPVRLRGIKRSLASRDLLHNFLFLVDWATTRPVRAASRHLSHFSPQVVVATGGYVCVPVALAARLRRLPVVALEQNACAGTAVKVLSLFVQSVILPYASSESGLSGRSRHHLWGNPVRQRILQCSRAEGREEFGLPERAEVLLITGGSLGSMELDKASVEALLELERHGALRERLYVLFHTGENHLQWVKESLKECRLKIQFYPFIDQMPEALAASDLVVARGGAMTVSELTARGIPAILLPWAGAARDHQRLNCESLVSQGGARMITSDDLSGGHLAEELLPLLDNTPLREAMADASKRAGHPRAAEEVASLVTSYAKQLKT